MCDYFEISLAAGLIIFIPIFIPQKYELADTEYRGRVIFFDFSKFSQRK